MSEGPTEEARTPLAATTTPGDPPWWRRGFALFSVLVAAAGPLTAAVHGFYTKSREIEVAREQRAAEIAIARQKEDYALRLQFLDRVVDPQYPAKDRATILRFLSSAISDPDVKRWANDERKVAEGEAADLEKALAASQREAQDAREKVAGLQRTSANDKRALASAVASLAEKTKQTSNLRQRLSSSWTIPMLECAGAAIGFHMGGPGTAEETAACSEGPGAAAEVSEDQLQIRWHTFVGKTGVFCTCTNAHPFNRKPPPKKK